MELIKIIEKKIEIQETSNWYKVIKILPRIDPYGNSLNKWIRIV